MAVGEAFISKLYKLYLVAFTIFYIQQVVYPL